MGGEASAFGLLYDRYQPRIYRFVLAKVGHREEAEDLTHQVFLKAWQNLGGYRFRGLPLSGWLYQIARNQVIDFYRTQKDHQSLESLDTDTVPDENNVESAAESSLRMETVRRVMNGLTGEQQDVVLLRFVDDLAIKDVAKIMKKSEGAVKLLQYRAILTLKQLLDSHD